jgi:hypothetical protein
VAVDSERNVYAATYNGGARKYAPSQFNTKGEPASSIPAGKAFDERGRTLAVDPGDSTLYIDEENGIAEYNDAGEPGRVGASGSGLLEGSFGVAVDGTSGKTGSGDVYAGNGDGRVDIFGGPVTIADASLEPVADLTRSSATLQGVVNPLGRAVTACDFEYWLEGEQANAQSKPCSPAPGSGSAPVAVTAALSGLPLNTTYSYRLVVTDANGVNDTPAESFRTEGAVEGIRTEPATGIEQFSAALHGSFAPNGLDTHYYFEYGETG